jgi:hypothetical protein
MGYTLLYTKFSNEHVASLYAQFPDLVKAVVMNPDMIEECLGSTSCIKSAENPLGVPLWKIFSFNFWNSAEHPLGGAWTISPEDWPRIHPDGGGKDNFYLGYSVERACRTHRVVPTSERPGHVYIFGKLYKFFTPDEDYAWEGVDFPSLGFSAVAGVILDSGVPLPDDMPLPGGITNLGRLNQSAFLNAIGSARAVLGVGNPQTSPTAYDALCLGVPFVNPVTGWAGDDPEDRTRWYVQHEGLKFEDEPYVYHVRHGDVDGLRRALRKAYETPIDRSALFVLCDARGYSACHSRYILERMREDAVKARLGDLLTRDWRARAARILEEREQAGNTQVRSFLVARQCRPHSSLAVRTIDWRSRTLPFHHVVLCTIVLCKASLDVVCIYDWR